MLNSITLEANPATHCKNLHHWIATRITTKSLLYFAAFINYCMIKTWLYCIGAISSESNNFVCASVRICVWHVWVNSVLCWHHVLHSNPEAIARRVSSIQAMPRRKQLAMCISFKAWKTNETNCMMTENCRTWFSCSDLSETSRQLVFFPYA